MSKVSGVSDSKLELVFDLSFEFNVGLTRYSVVALPTEALDTYLVCVHDKLLDKREYLDLTAEEILGIIYAGEV